LEAAVALSLYWEHRSRHREAVGTYEQVIAAAGPDALPSIVLLKAMYLVAYFINLEGDEVASGIAIQRLQRYAEMPGWGDWQVLAYCLRAGVAWRTPGRLAEAEALAREGWKAVSNDPLNFGRIALATFLGGILQQRGDAETALPYALEAADTAVRRNRPIDQPLTAVWLGLTLLQLGRIEEGRARFIHAATLGNQLRMPLASAIALLGLARADALAGDADHLARAARLIGCYEMEIERLGINFGDLWGDLITDSERRAVPVLGEDRLADLIAEGRDLSLDEALVLAQA
jgi:tetratricopeptide (TPR) repeat protein